MILSQLWQAGLRAPGSKNVSWRGCVAMWSLWQCGLLEPLKFRFCSRFSLRGVHYYALGGDFKGAAAPCVAMLLDCSSQLHVSRPLATNESHCQRGNVTVARSLRRQNGQPKSSLDAPAEM